MSKKTDLKTMADLYEAILMDFLSMLICVGVLLAFVCFKCSKNPQNKNERQEVKIDKINKNNGLKNKKNKGQEAKLNKIKENNKYKNGVCQHEKNERQEVKIDKINKNNGLKNKKMTSSGRDGRKTRNGPPAAAGPPTQMETMMHNKAEDSSQNAGQPNDVLPKHPQFVAAKTEQFVSNEYSKSKKSRKRRQKGSDSKGQRAPSTSDTDSNSAAISSVSNVHGQTFNHLTKAIPACLSEKESKLLEASGDTCDPNMNVPATNSGSEIYVNHSISGQNDHDHNRQKDRQGQHFQNATPTQKRTNMGQISTTRKAKNIDDTLFQKPKGNTNLGNTCYFNAALQALYFTYGLKETLSRTRARCAPAADCNNLRLLNDLLMLLMKQTESTEDHTHELLQVLSTVGQINHQYLRGTQEDSFELLTTLLGGIFDEIDQFTVGPQCISSTNN